MEKVKKVTLSGILFAIGLILPFFFGQIPAVGKMLLPMHIPVLICGLILGWQYGLAVGFLLPLVRSVLFGMPVLYPNAIAMASELSGIIRRILTERERIVIAIDGRCGSGKTTLGRELQEIWDGNLFHMDDFYLQKEQRTEERYEEPGGNVDYKRFEQEVLVPLKKCETVFYRPYYPPKWSFLETAEIAPCRANIVEGTYSCHERLEAYYDLKVFLTIDPIEQIQKIEKRNGSEKAVEFQKKWIPLEELYFEKCRTRSRCDVCFTMCDEM
ncbi:ECF transporter S component [Fusicatenibacter saccharivorans]|uniref:ECF transporter S component n=1 Tax=Fusicatenibacter saccharivorans TaxID=1150298 RepID=UPI003F8DEA50